MKKFSFNWIIRKQQPKVLFIEAIWKYWHRHLSISIVIAEKIFLPLGFFLFKKSKIFMFFLVLSYGISSLCYKELVLYDFLFIKSKASIGVLEKSYLNIQKHPFQNSVEFWNWILMYIFLFVCSNVLTAKCKTYLHFSYIKFIEYLQIHGITYITYLNI